MGLCKGKIYGPDDKLHPVNSIGLTTTEILRSNQQRINNPDKLQINTVYRNTNRIRDEYKIWMDQIGKGAFGEVRKALHLESGVYRAIKIIYKEQTRPEDQKKILNEIEVLKRLDHPNIVKIYEYFEDGKFIYIVMELVTGGELFDKIQSVHRFTEKKAAEYFIQILSGVNYLHKHKIVHRDLKPENVLFDGEILKIVDFGTSKIYDASKKMKKCHGTPYYIAPEVLNGSYTEKCDVWSCGVILYIMLCGFPPFNGKDDDEILDAVLKGKFNFNLPEFKHVSNTAKNLIKKMLTYNPKDRITIEETLADEWFKLVNNQETELNRNVLLNLKNFTTKNKMQQAIYFFLVNHMTSKEEQKELIKTFKALDTNNDGVISRRELLEGFKKIDNLLTEADVNSMMKKIDNNQSETIDYTEFVAAAIDKKNLLSDERIKTCFNMFDKDRSGKISLSEFKSMLGGEETVDDAVWADLIRQADENNDGEIEFLEFRSLLLKMIN